MSNLSYEQAVKNLKGHCDSLAEHSGVNLACLLEENGQIIVSSDFENQQHQKKDFRGPLETLKMKNYNNSGSATKYSVHNKS